MACVLTNFKRIHFIHKHFIMKSRVLSCVAGCPINITDTIFPTKLRAPIASFRVRNVRVRGRTRKERVLR